MAGRNVDKKETSPAVDSCCLYELSQLETGPIWYVVDPRRSWSNATSSSENQTGDDRILDA